MKHETDTLVLCWGNPGRRDDGLGPALAAELSSFALPGVVVESDYQLHPENAADIARCRRVFFVDADRRGEEPFSVERLEPARNGLSFTTHSVTPGALLTLTRDLFQAQPEAWLVGVRGYDFDEFGEGLSPRARSNLAAAAAWVRETLTPTDHDQEGEPCPMIRP